MELIERYLYAVCRKMPSRLRKDAEKQLRSSIMHELEARIPDGTPGEKEIVDVLRRFGPPDKVARQYAGKWLYVIGPELYDLYFLLVKLASLCVLVYVFTSFALERLQNGFGAGDIPGLVWRMCTGIFAAIGAVTVVFILAERLSPGSEPETGRDDADWDPESLPEVPGPGEAIRVSDVVFGLIFTLLLFIFLNFYPLLVRNYFQTDDPEVAKLVSLVDLGVIKPYMVYINILFVLAFLKFFLLLKDGRYRLYTLTMEIIGDLGSLIILVQLLLGPAIVEVPSQNLGAVDMAELTRLMDVISMLYRGILLVSGVALATDLVGNTLKFTRCLAKYRERAG